MHIFEMKQDIQLVSIHFQHENGLYTYVQSLVRLLDRTLKCIQSFLIFDVDNCQLKAHCVKYTSEELPRPPGGSA